MPIEQAVPLPYLPTLMRLGLALSLGLFIGLERERRGKEAGLRTFGFVALLGCLGGLLGQAYALLALVLIGVLVIFMNLHEMLIAKSLELTTSAAMLLIGYTGVLCGLGHTFTPTAVVMLTTALLAWKDRLAGFSVGLTEAELRSAILLGILALVVYPVLPEEAIDPFGLIELRVAWMTVILIAGIGFVNYVLWKLYGSRGVEMAGFLGGLVNSSVTAAELANRHRESGGALAGLAYRGTLLATTASVLRNSVLLGLLAPRVLLASLLPLALMGGASLLLAYRTRWKARPEEAQAAVPPLHLESPFSLASALKFGLLFLVLQVAGVIAQAQLGRAGFYAVSLVGGLVSSASALASAATLATQGAITLEAASIGAVLASLASVLVNLPLFARLSADRALTHRLARALLVVTVLGLLGVVLESHVVNPLMQALKLPLV